jgi:AraC family ethanolamine operon transcriptional activator
VIERPCNQIVDRLERVLAVAGPGPDTREPDGLVRQPLPEPAVGIDASAIEICDISLFNRGSHWRQQRWQLSPGPFLARWTRVVLAPGVWVIHETSNRGQRILAEPIADFLAVGYHTTVERSMRLDGAVVGPDEPVVYARGAALDATVPGGVEAWHVYFSPEAFPLLWAHDASRNVLMDRWLNAGITPIRGDAVHAAALKALLMDLAAVQSWPEAWAKVPGGFLADLAAEHVGRLLLSAMPRPPEVTVGRPSLRRMAAVEAERYLFTAGDRPVSTLELCRHIGVSERTLQAAMLEQIGQSPMEYMRTIRMNQAHKALREPAAETTVHSVAMRFGFLHHGRFAAQYREQFGESPGQTLRKHQARRGLSAG